MTTTSSPSSDHGCSRRSGLPGSEPWLDTLRRVRVARLGVIVGSFDPPHLGHEWMARSLLGRVDAVLLLLPTVHYAKRVRPLHTAAFEQRLDMLRLAAPRLPKPALVGLTDEVLFVRLERRLCRLLPRVEVVFGMGSDTFGKVRDSARLAAILGVPWLPEDEAAVAPLLGRAVVFAREPGAVPGAVAVPDELLGVSSTVARQMAARLRAAGAGLERWLEELGGCLAPEVTEYTFASGLYPQRRPRMRECAPVMRWHPGA